MGQLLGLSESATEEVEVRRGVSTATSEWIEVSQIPRGKVDTSFFPSHPASTAVEELSAQELQEVEIRATPLQIYKLEPQNHWVVEEMVFHRSILRSHVSLWEGTSY